MKIINTVTTQIFLTPKKLDVIFLPRDDMSSYEFEAAFGSGQCFNIDIATFADGSAMSLSNDQIYADTKLTRRAENIIQRYLEIVAKFL